VAGAFAPLQGHKYLSLASFRKNGQAIHTPLWFAENAGKVYVMTRDDSWKFKRIRNNPRVRVAPSTMRGRIVGPEIEGRARILSANEFPAAHTLLQRKYWLMRIPLVWSKRNVFIEIVPM